MSKIQITDGAFFDYADPMPETISITDIALSLSRIPRFLGRTRVAMNVAHHSVLVSLIVPRRDAFAGLMHDAHEAFVGDLPSPAKSYFRKAYGAQWDHFESTIAWAVRRRFGLALEVPGSVKHADLVALATEKRDLFDVDVPPAPGQWPSLPTPLPTRLKPLPPAMSVALFMQRFAELCPAGLR